ncbi:flavin reductase family protein [Sabulicella glaciei]|uniref:Flavin reductase family protein n=1 Tax=Sabulicella glaciei TaxID=2984948 RepID=A0ABT3NY70_9PROT|nr:flavin reductase family protein [Roseococcus sp. MDT2-1-1]MCW8087104.1 flavin reductase family protein [Roseococcus sp. MDT2-1-1]
MLFDFASLPAVDQGKLLRATVTPRPIAWVTTQHADGRTNAAPFSFFNLLCSEPPLLGLGITPRAGEAKDTGNNIRRSGEFVVNLVSHALAERMNATSAEVGPEVDELAANGLGALPSHHVAPPRIGGCPAALECRLHTLLRPGGEALIVIGEVLALHLEDHAVLDAARCHVDTPSMDLVARMHGRGWYARSTDLFEIGRPITQEAPRETP